MSDAELTSRLTANRWKALTSRATGSLQARAPGANVRPAPPLKVSLVFVRGITDAPVPDTPMNAPENATGLCPRVFSSLIRSEVPEIVGRTIMRTVLLLRAGAVSRTLWATVHAENHCGL